MFLFLPRPPLLMPPIFFSAYLTPIRNARKCVSRGVRASYTELKSTFVLASCSYVFHVLRDCLMFDIDPATSFFHMKIIKQIRFTNTRPILTLATYHVNFRDHHKRNAHSYATLLTLPQSLTNHDESTQTR